MRKIDDEVVEKRKIKIQNTILSHGNENKPDPENVKTSKQGKNKWV